MKPTKESIIALREKGMTIDQIAKFYQCSTRTIYEIKGREAIKVGLDSGYKNPISPEELAEAKNIKIGESVRYLNLYRMGGKDGEGWGVWETNKITKKLPNLVILDNGKTVENRNAEARRKNLKLPGSRPGT